MGFQTVSETGNSNQQVNQTTEQTSFFFFPSNTRCSQFQTHAKGKEDARKCCHENLNHFIAARKKF